MKTEKTIWITQTAIFLALLIVLQTWSASLANTLVTGSIVNMLLIVSTMTCGYSSALAVSIVSPILAKFIGIGPLWSLIPFVILGNCTLVLLWYFIGNSHVKPNLLKGSLCLIVGSFAKFLVLYLGIVKLAVPLLLNLPQKQAMMISSMFSLSQLLTAILGGILALLVIPSLEKVVKRKAD